MARIIRRSLGAIRHRLTEECRTLYCYRCTGCSHWCHNPDAWR